MTIYADIFDNGGGGVIPIETIDGDIGSITGMTVTIFANNAAVNSGSSVLFNNAGTVSTLNVTDGSSNTMIGNLAGNLTLSGGQNTSLGAFTSSALTTGSLNVAVGYGALENVTSGHDNCVVGSQAGEFLLTGVFNTALGAGSGNALIAAESGNIYVSNEGIAGESHVIRIGTQGNSNAGPTGQQNICYIAGITGATPVSANTPQVVVCDNLGNLTPISSSTAGFVLTSNGSATPSFQHVGILWNDVTVSPQTLVSGQGFVTDNVAGITYVLPASANFGDEISIVGKLGAWTVTQNANQQIRLGSSSSTVGVGGSVSSTNVGDCIDMVCITGGASSIWRIRSSEGNITIV